jgi:hypothetical protein
MEPGGRYTTPDADGNFGFYNLPEGLYQIKLDAKSLPTHGVMTSEEEFPAMVKIGQASPPIHFGYVIKIPEKPVHRTLEQTIRIDATGDAVPVKEAPKPTVAAPDRSNPNQHQ